MDHRFKKTEIVFVDGAAYMILTFGRRPYRMTIILTVCRKTKSWVTQGISRGQKLAKPLPPLGGSACKSELVSTMHCTHQTLYTSRASTALSEARPFRQQRQSSSQD